MAKKLRNGRTGLLAALGLILFGTLLASLVYYQYDNLMVESPWRRGRCVREVGYTLTNPLLYCDVAGEGAPFGEFESLKSRMEGLVRTERKKAGLDRIAVYFMDLTSGAFVEINKEDKFIPASLLKVPLMVAYLKWAEEDPRVFNTKLAYDGSFDENVGEVFKPPISLKPHHLYQPEELIERMIRYSDNNATRLLADNADKAVLLKTYVELGLIVAGVKSLGPWTQIAADDYATLFRILFNATYLNRKDSEKALRLLAESDFKQGLAAPLPPAIAVAHKFGERIFDLAATRAQLHDCGIIYYPGRPYLLCVMTEGRNLAIQADAIRDLSLTAYEFAAK